MTAGDRLGNYQLLEPIGSGGMGDVYRALDIALERPVAVKILKPALAADEDLKGRFRAEARTLAQLQHSNITQLYDLVEEQGTLGMVMEFAEGETLEQHLRERGALAVDRALRIFVQCLDAFDAAHRQGVVHRDIKPANVMLCAGDRVKVMDFGVARIVGSERNTVAGHLVGTPRYMSPEQILGREADARTDIYSLGILLHEMLAGEPPYAQGNDFAVMRAQVEAAVEVRALRAAGIPEAVVAIAARAMAKRPEERYQSALELQVFCNRCLEELEVDTQGQPNFESLDRAEGGAARWWRYGGAAAVLAVLIAAGAMGYQGTRGQADPPATAAKAVCPELPPVPKETPFEMPSGAALSRRDVILLLEAGTPLKRMQKIIDLRGVDFVNGAASAAEILKAGGTHELNGWVALNHRPPAVVPRPVRRPEAMAEPAPATASALQGQSLLR